MEDNKWISVEESGLPENNNEVLVWREHYTTDGIPVQAYYNPTKKKWMGSIEVTDCMKEGYVENRELIFEPTHYMNLPSPPLK